MNSDSDLQIAGDILAVQHLLQPAKEHPGTVAEFAGLARSIATDRAQWAPLVQYDATTRWYHRLRTGPGYEVWLLSWVPGQGTGLHDHGRSSGLMTVLEGELTERTENGARVLEGGAQRVIAPGRVHEIVNDSLEPAVSLHVYYPGLTDMPMHAADAAGAARDAAGAARRDAAAGVIHSFGPATRSVVSA
ncbi:cysteine dioxygenase family protein [Streptomyces sp. TRM64462]|uniref:cysteine dioxygenase n=1 Tax=Streptomyces sp. TRM64462 TaxID=2741726 RepID=UPI001585E157|nr:cysteine dioxygenase family protein [Streptomyces sp. TRM64462]